jgi:serine/threonine-protein kinase
MRRPSPAVLKAKLLPEEIERVAEVATQNTEAHDLYLRGRVYFNRASDQFALTANGNSRRRSRCRTGARQGSRFALAEADLATAHMNMYWFAPDRMPGRLCRGQGRRGSGARHQPGLVAAHSSAGALLLLGIPRLCAALQHLEIARPRESRTMQTSFQFIASIARRRAAVGACTPRLP